MRTIEEIDLEISAVSARLAELENERRAVRQDRVDQVLGLFDAGLSRHEIARQLGMGAPAVSGILWRNGRTVGGREDRRRIGANTTERLDRMLHDALSRGAPA